MRPHLVSPLPFLIPLFGRDGVVSKTVARSYATALWLYDLTGGWRIGERHREVTKDEALAHLPTLSTDHLVAGFLYFDARADDARLTLTVARTAAFEFGAVGRQLHPGRPPDHGRGRDRRRRRRAAGARRRDVGVPDPGPDRGQRLGRLGRRSAGPRRGPGSPCHPAGQGRPRDRAGGPAAVRHRGGHPRPQGQAVHFRRVVARDGPRLSGHHRHRLHGPARRSRLHPRGRRLPAGRRQRHHHLAPHPGRRHRRLGRPAPAPGAPGQGRPRLGAHGRPLAPPHGQRRPATAW